MKHFSLPKEGGLLEYKVPKGILHSYEKIYTEIRDLSETACADVAEVIINAINDFDYDREGRKFKLGLTTGRTPLSLYKILVNAYKSGKVSFKNVEAFTIDEYYPIAKTEPQSRNYRLHKEFIDKVDFEIDAFHVPDSTASTSEVSETNAAFDKIASNLDLLVIGMGENGQVGFNEAGTTLHSRTRTVLMSYNSRKRQSENFAGSIEDTPTMALTMGLGTMMSAKQVILMAFGENKAKVVKNIVEGEVSTSCPASMFQNHNNVSLYVDETAAENLTRVVAPWCVGSCDWTPKFRRKAVVWLCQKVGKPILKLDNQDYLDNGLGELIHFYGPYQKINIEVFNDLQHTITGWPGGKPNADDSTRPVSSTPYPKKVLIFSPHPDDDVISMGGTFIRLVHQGHDVHVAYETSGNIAVHDDVVIQHMDAAYELGLGDRRKEVADLVAGKMRGAAEPAELLKIKGAIRRSEAKGAVRSFGLKEENVHFLNLPFYESGATVKLPRTQADVDIIKKLMNEIQPDQIYMAGDLADPHGTHRVCTEAALEALEQLREEGQPWVENTHVWLYRGAWMEWELGRVDMAVPLSPDEVVEKRYAIYHHLSQKDIVPFPGDDPREFWQRAEDRTQNTARLYDQLGMAEYQAIEVFLRLF